MPVKTRKRGRRESCESPGVEFPCIRCQHQVSGRHQAVKCDGCGGWQHRKCFTGITAAFYREAAKNGQPFAWMCAPCMAEMPTHCTEQLNGQAPSPESSTSLEPVRSQSPALQNPGNEELSLHDVQVSSPGGDVSMASIPSSEDATDLELGSPVGESSRTLDNTDSLDDIPVQPVQEVLEESLIDPVVTDDIGGPGCQEVQYTIVNGSSQRRTNKLVDTRGYSYTKYSEKKDGTITWRCTVRNRQMFCGATIRQVGETFHLGPRDHCHPGTPDQLTVASVIAQLKTAATDNLFEPASNIVDGVLLNNINEGPVPSLPKPSNLTRVANRFRQKQRPQDPTDLDFVLQHDAIPPDFLQTDVRVKNRRHLLFCTTNQQVLLARSKRWYLDATFKVVRAPFTQLLGIHCFVKKDTATKQVPLVFVMMSGRKKRDYKAVLEALIQVLPQDICLAEVLVDFETALWAALRSVFPGVSVKGCCFHWKQAVWRKIQETGLQPAYMEKAEVFKLLQRLMSLPFLPAELIPPMFASLQRKAGTQMLQRVFDYVGTTWINSELWPPAAWSCYKQSVRTNNDCEGWHLRLQTKARKINVPLYPLIQVLHTEAMMVNIQVRLVSENKLRRHQRKVFVKTQGRIFQYWTEFEDGQRSAKQLLHACASVQGNAPVIRV